jgi:matrixin
MKRVLLLAVVLLALGASSAKAEPFGPEENQAYEIAIGYWGREPTQCKTIEKTVEAVDGEGGHATQPSPEVAPYSMPCVLVINPEATHPFGVLCDVMAHEVGHLLGYGHSTDPASVMYPTPAPVLFAQCTAIERERERAEFRVYEFEVEHEQRLGELSELKRGCKRLQHRRVATWRKSECWAHARRMRLHIQRHP